MGTFFVMNNYMNPDTTVKTACVVEVSARMDPVNQWDFFHVAP